MTDELERLDRLLSQLGRMLDAPGEEGEASPEWTWQKLDLLEQSMGPDALTALLRRQGMSRATVEEALGVLARRRDASS
ncbi:MAG: hypothetical protein QOD61_1076 [Solirubrobacteraceae bacterium]|jgi:hypothetical protein|nr:hypothetical protein [Solirubrobacteraceae bacterium]